jgi:hypothetical protein
MKPSFFKSLDNKWAWIKSARERVEQASNLSYMSNLNECCSMYEEEKCLTADLNSSQSTEAESEIRVSLLLGLTK